MGRGRYLGFIDADGDISPELLAPFVSIMQSMEPDIIIGSKRHPDSSVHYPPLRRLYSWGYQHLIAAAVPPARQGHPGRDQAGGPQR